MKEIAINYLKSQLNAGVDYIGLATTRSMRIFHMEDLIELIEANDENLILRDHDGIRLKKLGEAPRTRELQAFFGNKAMYHFPLMKCDKTSCENETAAYLGGEVTGGNTDCPWDVIVKGIIKIQIKGIGGAMSKEAREAEDWE